MCAEDLYPLFVRPNLCFCVCVFFHGFFCVCVVTRVGLLQMMRVRLHGCQTTV